MRELALAVFGCHVRVEELGNGAASGVPGYEEAGEAAGWVFLEECAEALGDGAEHGFGDLEEAGVAVVFGVVEEAAGGGGFLSHVDGPVHEGGCAADGEDDGVHFVDG